MTREEATLILSNMIHDDKAVYGRKDKKRNIALDMAIEALKEEIRPHGEWLRKNNSNSWFECSVCKDVSDVVTIMREPTWKFCPNCGASMVKEGEEE